jgi:glycosyltransferase involved in cell wall biosynthesis
MKICFFADSESIHTVRWCMHFKQLGHDVHLISFKSAEVPNIPTYFVDTSNISVKGGNWKVLFKYRKVKKIIKQINPDIVHALYATSYGITGALCGFKPYVITALGSDLLLSPQNSKVYRFLLKYAFSKAQFITVMSDQMKIEAEKLNVPESKVMTLPFGIDPQLFNAKQRKLDTSKFVVTSTRNFETVYNIPHLLKAIALVKKGIPNIHLNLIGAGSLKSEIKSLVNELELNEIVTFFGKIPQVEIVKVLNQSNVFVSVSLSDGNNISLNEAMACEALCIATDIPANTQWITHEENGFLVKINDVEALAEYLRVSERNYEELQQKSLPLSRKLLHEKGIWEVNMKRMEDQYKRLVNKS